jgi:hypothetical protein
VPCFPIRWHACKSTFGLENTPTSFKTSHTSLFESVIWDIIVNTNKFKAFAS